MSFTCIRIRHHLCLCRGPDTQATNGNLPRECEADSPRCVVWTEAWGCLPRGFWSENPAFFLLSFSRPQRPISHHGLLDRPWNSACICSFLSTATAFMLVRATVMSYCHQLFSGLSSHRDGLNDPSEVLTWQGMPGLQTLWAFSLLQSQYLASCLACKGSLQCWSNVWWKELQV